jgi:transcriptional regulator with XRE-family HTH domain
MNIGARVREAREDLGMSQAELARRAGVARNHIVMIEHGGRTPSVGLLEKIAHELRTEPAELLREPVPLDKASEVAGPKVVTGSAHIKVDRETFAILQAVLTGEVYEVIDGLADGELSREEAKEEVKELLERVLEPAL